MVQRVSSVDMHRINRLVRRTEEIISPPSKVHVKGIRIIREQCDMGVQTEPPESSQLLDWPSFSEGTSSFHGGTASSHDGEEESDQDEDEEEDEEEEDKEEDEEFVDEAKDVDSQGYRDGLEDRDGSALRVHSRMGGSLDRGSRTRSSRSNTWGGAAALLPLSASTTTTTTGRVRGTSTTGRPSLTVSALEEHRLNLRLLEMELLWRETNISERDMQLSIRELQVKKSLSWNEKTHNHTYMCK